MNRRNSGEFLSRFFEQRKASFLANVYKASITGSFKDIHRTRLDVKKIFALYSLFEMLDITTFNQDEYKFFIPLYRHAGKIREIQVNYLLLAKHESGDEKFPAFIQWLKDQELQATQKFIQSVKKIREEKLISTEKKVQEICNGKSMIKIRSKTKEYISNRAILVQELQAGNPGEKELHQIRKHLKAISTVTALVNTIKPENDFDRVLTGLNKIDIMIGDWHDCVVLRKTIGKFLKGEPVCSDQETRSLQQLKNHLEEERDNLVQHFLPEIEAVVQSALLT